MFPPFIVHSDRAAQSPEVSQSKPINPFLTIDKPNSIQSHTHRPRYTPKVRHEPTQKQAPPQISLQYTLKAWKQPPEQATLEDLTPKKPPAPIQPKLEEAILPGRKDIMKALTWEHPTVALDLGSLTKNTCAVLKDDGLSDSVVQCIRGAVRAASNTKRRCQEVIGRYLEDVFFPRPAPNDPRPKVPTTAISSEDQSFLDWLCPRLSSKQTIEATDDDDGIEDGSSDDNNTVFLRCFLTFLYSDNLPNSGSKTGQATTKFIRRLQQLTILSGSSEQSAEKVKNVKEYTPSYLVRSVASQLGAELKRHYRYGSIQLSEKVQSNQLFFWLVSIRRILFAKFSVLSSYRRLQKWKRRAKSQAIKLTSSCTQGFQPLWFSSVSMLSLATPGH